VDALERAVQAHVEALAMADRACRTALQSVAERLSALTGPGTDANWTGSMVPAAAGTVLAAAGVLDTDEQAALWATIRAKLWPARWPGSSCSPGAPPRPTAPPTRTGPP
jgi:hypothetical protein